MLAGVTDEGDEVTVTGPLAHVQAGETVAGRGHLARAPAPRAPARGRPGPAAGGDERRGARGAPGGRQARRARAARRGSSSATAPSGSWPSSTATRAGACARCRASGRCACGPPSRRGRRRAPSGRCGSSSTSTGSRPRPPARIARALGPGAIERLRTDPWSVAEVDGVGFATADALARGLGTPPDDPGRLDAGLLHALGEAEADGHCFLPRGELAARARRLLGVDAARTRRRPGGGRAARGRPRRRRGGPPGARPRRGAPGPAGAGAVRRAAAAAPARREAAHGRLRPHRSAVVGGGARPRPPARGPHGRPRDGQDELHAGARRRPARCGPQRPAVRADGQGRAAPGRDHRCARHDDPPPARVGARRRLRARARRPHPGNGRPRGRRGVDALRPRSPTRCSARSGRGRTSCSSATSTSSRRSGRAACSRTSSPLGGCRRSRLTEVFRQAARSLIVRAAHAIDEGREPPTRAADGDVRDFFRVVRDEPSEVFAEVVSLAAERLPGHFGLDPRRDVLVLAPMHRGPVGRRRAQRGAAPPPEPRRRARARDAASASATACCRRATTTSAS